jgi:prepilin-type N-terminal cleavage/methylation domain-containing protein
MRPRSHVRARDGFTLPELVVSILILTVGLLALASVMGASMGRQRLASSRAEMTIVAEAKLEELRGYGTTPVGNALRNRLNVGGSLTVANANYSDSTVTLGGRWYRRRWTVANDVAGTRRVTVRVVPAVRRDYDLTQLDFTSLVGLR